MISTILWYHENSALFIELLGTYSLQDYVQVCHKARDCYLEFQNQPIDLIIDFRAVDMRESDVLPLEPIENLLHNPMTKRLCLLPDMRLAAMVIELVQTDMNAQIHVLPHLHAVDELICV